MISARDKWSDVMDEVKRSFGPRPGLIDIRNVMTMTENVAGIAMDPSKPSGWVKAVAGLPFNVVQRLIARGPVIEIHKLREHLPGPVEGRENIKALFGVDVGA